MFQSISNKLLYIPSFSHISNPPTLLKAPSQTQLFKPKTYVQTPHQEKKIQTQLFIVQRIVLFMNGIYSAGFGLKASLINFTINPSGIFEFNP